MRVHRNAFLTIACLTVPALVTAAHAQGPEITWQAPTAFDAPNATAPSYRAALASDDGVIHMTWMRGAEARYARSLDLGVTWQDEVSLTANNGGAPWVQANGDIVLTAWLEKVGGDRQMVSSRSTDGGVSWGAAQVVSPVGTFAGVDFAFSGPIAARAWATNSGAQVTYHTSISQDAGVTWDAEVVAITTDAGNAFPGSVQVAVSGSNVVVAHNDSDKVGVATTANFGATWGDSTLQTGVAATRLESMSSDGSTVLFQWRHVVADYVEEQYVARSSDSGVTWEPAVNISAAVVPYNILGAVDIDGPFAVSLWGSAPGNTGTRAVTTATSYDGAATWGSVQIDTNTTPQPNAVTVEGTAVVAASFDSSANGGVWTHLGTLSGVAGLTVGSHQTAPGAVVVVPVEITDTSSLGLRSVSLTLAYDPALLTPVTANTTLGILDANWSLEQNVAVAGEWAISMAADPTYAPSGSGALVTVEFDVNAAAVNGDTSSLALTRADLNEGLVDSVVTSGSVTVVNVVYGDVSGNGAPTAYDASWDLQYVVDHLLVTDDGSPFFPIEITAPVWDTQPVPHLIALIVADVDGDGISATDASAILQYDVGLVVTFPAETGGAAPGIAPTASVAALSGTSTSERPGGRITVTLDASAVDDLYAGELVLDFDGAVLRPVGVTLSRSGEVGAAQRPLLVRRDGDGRVAIAFASARPLASSGSSLDVTFETARDISHSVDSSIRASHLRLNGSRIATDFAFPFRVEPFQTRLMANYPNPFNPETWIPFELAEESEVTVRIYGMAGELVRALELGALPVGEYVGRDRAAYWDGANEQGERVASGAYVYELAAGEHRALRRMVVLK